MINNFLFVSISKQLFSTTPPITKYIGKNTKAHDNSNDVLLVFFGKLLPLTNTKHHAILNM